MGKDQIEFRMLALPTTFYENLHKICKLYIKRLLFDALNSTLNGFSPAEEIFS